MPEWAQAVLRWTVALVGMALVVWIAIPRALEALSHSISFDMNGGGAAPETTPSPAEEPETTSGEATATASASVSESVLNELAPAVTTLSADTVDELLLAFEPVPTDPACLTEAHLEVAVSDPSGEPSIQVQPARVADLEALEVGEPLPPDVGIDAGDPAAATADPDAETLEFTVTAVYSIAAREAQPDADVVLSLALAPGSEGAVTLVSATGDAEGAPRLTWTAVAGCPDLEAQDA